MRTKGLPLFILILVFGFTGISWLPAQAQLSCRKALTHPASDAQFSTHLLQQKFSAMKESYEWANGSDLTVDYLRLVPSVDFFRAQHKGIIRQDIYGKGVFKDWANANERLNSIPKGRLQLSLSLFQEVHTISTKNVTPFLKKISHLLPQGLVPDAGGVFKARNSVGRDPMIHPLSEQVYRNIKSNPWLGGFVEMPAPFSREGSRRGFLLYARAKDTPQKLQELIDWYEANKNRMDPIDLAADFQRAFVSIHPFVDGNGRTSRLFMDRILREHGLPPPLLPTHNNDVYMSQQEYRSYIRRGIERFYRVWEKSYEDSRSLIETPHYLANPQIRNDQTSGRKALTDLLSTAAGGVLARTPFEVGGRPFRFSLGNGLFFDTFAVPHIYREGKLLPISDKSMWLYALADAPARENLYVDQIKLLKLIIAKDQTVQDVQIGSYEAVKQANLKGELFLYDWQKPILESALNVQMDAPEAILSRRSLAKTFFEENIHTSPQHKMASLILAQYEYLDIEYREYHKYAEKNFPDLAPKAAEARRRIHWAARKLLEPIFKKAEALSPEHQKIFKQENFYKVFQAYLAGSKLKFRNFDTAIEEMGDTHVTLLRSDNNMAQWVGFRSRADWNDLARSLPGHNHLIRMARDLGKKFEKKDFQDKVMAVLNDPNSTWNRIKSFLPESLQKTIGDVPENTFWKFQEALRNILISLQDPARYDSVVDQVDRAVIDLAAHAQGGIPVKVGTSFSTYLGMYTEPQKSSNDISFGPSDSHIARLFLVKVPYEKVTWNYGTSQFTSEYEIVSLKPISRREIVTSFTGEDLMVKEVREYPAPILELYQVYR